MLACDDAHDMALGVPDVTPVLLARKEVLANQALVAQGHSVQVGTSKGAGRGGRGGPGAADGAVPRVRRSAFDGIRQGPSRTGAETATAHGRAWHAQDTQKHNHKQNI